MKNELTQIEKEAILYAHKIVPDLADFETYKLVKQAYLKGYEAATSEIKANHRELNDFWS